MKIHAPRSHPRYLSNYYRDLLVAGVSQGIVSPQGLIAHGRGETFDYLIGEKTHPFARVAIETAAAMLISAKHPVISVNGNAAILAPKDLVALAKILQAPLEVNIFHPSPSRERKIAKHLENSGAKKILFPDKATIPGIESNRRTISTEGQTKADVVFVPLEDGDRTEALIAMGKKVITIDLNPLSRTAQKATVTIVDNIVRVIPALIKEIKKLKSLRKETHQKTINNYRNEKILKDALRQINNNLTKP